MEEKKKGEAFFPWPIYSMYRGFSWDLCNDALLSVEWLWRIQYVYA